jgi:serine carboxypeptidase-like clade 1
LTRNVGTQGYVLGNPVADDEINTDSVVPFVPLKALLYDK